MNNRGVNPVESASNREKRLCKVLELVDEAIHAKLDRTGCCLAFILITMHGYEPDRHLAIYGLINSIKYGIGSQM